MPRQPRNKVVGNEAWYHLFNYAAAHVGEYPLEKPGAKEKFMELLEHYARIYYCDILTASCLGNHYHIEAYFAAYRMLDRKALLEKALLFHPGTEKQILAWPDKKWERLNERLFNVSDFMKDLQQAFATWYNLKFHRKGRFWGDRYKNTILCDLEAVRQCMRYIDLNAFRANLVESPEDYPYSTLYQRLHANPTNLIPLSKVCGEGPESDLKGYLESLHQRGAVRTKANQRVLTPAESERDRRLRVEADAAERYFVDGLVVGSKTAVGEWLDQFRAKGVFQRRKHPVQHGHNGPFSVREQRSNHVSQNYVSQNCPTRALPAAQGAPTIE